MATGVNMGAPWGARAPVPWPDRIQFGANYPVSTEQCEKDPNFDVNWSPGRRFFTYFSAQNVFFRFIPPLSLSQLSTWKVSKSTQEVPRVPPKGSQACCNWQKLAAVADNFPKFGTVIGSLPQRAQASPSFGKLRQASASFAKLRQACCI